MTAPVEQPVTNPFAPPGTDGSPSRDPPAVGPAGYHDQQTVVRILVGLLGAHAAIGAFDLLMAVLVSVSLLSDESAQWLSEHTPWIDAVSKVLLVVTMVVFATFLVRTNRNARSFRGEILAFSPPGMVGWYFAPIFNFAVPYQAVREVWRASRAAGTDVVNDDAVVKWWWATFLASPVVVFLSVYVVQQWIDAAPKWLLLNGMNAVQSLAMVARAVAALIMVRALHERQRRRAAQEARATLS